MTQDEADLCVEEERVEAYAVASVIYYTGGGRCTGLSDAQYDGLCDWLRQRKVWKRFGWLEEGMLAAGSGYDVSVIPQVYHEIAKEVMRDPCNCLRCMAARGEIKDPEVLERLGCQSST